MKGTMRPTRPRFRRAVHRFTETLNCSNFIDAKSERAANWYRGYGAEPLSGKPLTLVMPLATFAADLRAKACYNPRHAQRS
ncbi:hypothetical protein [Mesorhizobium sp. WSM4884]|uniref:hypothetical protein n=1 Tax=Mesorhizobium sp. WSM4884 TaxID=3038542 RepID=UPI0024164607|nr:hypothetical protein [Mesorhizobium sp. WSM4884]MDG4885224.1 hypothetical protein [Mesorhizobium sp. WSM4884]